MWRFLDAHFEDLLGALMLAVMVTVAFINVIVRYFTSFSFAWSEEITVNFCSARHAPSVKAATCA